MNQQIYICDSCGAEFAKWAGKCSQCGEWNTIKEIKLDQPKGQRSKAKAQETWKLSKVKMDQFKRITTGMSEFDTVLGKGFVPGSIILLGGEPGIGKSTLIMQIADCLQTTAGKNQKAEDARRKAVSSILYVSGEESFSQIKARADRLRIKSEIELLAETDVDNIIATAEKTKPLVLIIDSIQSIFDGSVSASAGSISQVKACGLKLQRFAKNFNIPVILIGHVTKSGAVAGPKTLEHLVDTVAYLEGERFQNFRILRCSKNRFGSVNEVGVFEMTGGGLSQVKNVSQEIINKRQEKIEGSAVAVILEGTRPFLVEIQALASKSYLGFPQRKSSGFDYNRMQLILAVLSARAGLMVGSFDIYLNVIGGFQIKDPSCDLAAAIAISSAIKKRPIKKDLVILGEVGLGGDIRAILNLGKRIKEAKTLGFPKVMVPKSPGKTLTTKDKSFTIIEVENIGKAISGAISK